MGVLRSLALVAFVAVASPTRANLIVNGSFELGAWRDTWGGWMDVPAGSTLITGWRTTDNRLAWARTPTTDGIVAQDGRHSIDLTGFGGAAAGLTQSVPTVQGQAYQLSFRVDQLIGTATVVATAGATSSFFSTARAGWQPFNMTFVASADEMSITLTGALNRAYIGLDNVVLSAVPEPSSIAMLACAVPLLWAVRLRRTRVKSSPPDASLPRGA